MHTSPTIRDWMHHAHERSTKAARFTSHLLHERNFWAVIAIVALIAGLFVLIAYFGSSMAMSNYGVPAPYGVYY